MFLGIGHLSSLHMYKGRASALLSFHQQRSSDFSFISCLQCIVVSIFFAHSSIFSTRHSELPLPNLIPPNCLVEMMSKSLTIQAFIALIILASSLSFSVNAAAIAPARQFLFFGPVV
jgi:hypothetical protein